MSNLDIAVSSFWQLARHWKSGQKAKLELACEDGSLHLQLSTMLGHPDHASFPPSPSSCKRKSPSQLRRKERRREQGLHTAGKAASDENDSSQHSEKETTEELFIPEDTIEVPAADKTTKPAEKPAKAASLKCDQCAYEVICKASLIKHVLKKHKKAVTHERFKCNECSENQENKNDLTNHMISEHDHPGEILSCDLCQFMTSRMTCLSIHIAKKHKDIEQLDGTSSDTDDPYPESYWERDYMGTVYQNYLDAIDNI